MVPVQLSPFYMVCYIRVHSLLLRPLEEKPRSGDIVLYSSRLVSGGLEILPEGDYILPLRVPDTILSKVPEKLPEVAGVALYGFRSRVYK